MDNCSHYETVDDYHTGDLICTSCGLVLQEKLPFEFPINHNQEETKLASESAVNSYHLMLIDFCFNASVPLKLATAAYELYKQTRKDRDLTLITNNTRAHLFASMYVTLHNHGSSFTLREIAAHCNIDLRTLTRLTRTIYDQYMNIESYPLASNIIQRLCANLQIERKRTLQIFKNVQDFETKHCLGLNPATVSAAFVHLYARSNMPDLTLKMICDMSGISTVSVKRFLNRFKLQEFVGQ